MQDRGHLRRVPGRDAHDRLDLCAHHRELFSSFETFIPWIALALLGYNQWDANRADKASQDALGKLEETLTETMEDKTKDEEPVVQPELTRSRK